MLGKEYSVSANMYCPQATAPTQVSTCEEQLIDYGAMCEKSTYFELCKRQAKFLKSPEDNVRVFEVCTEGGHLATYFDKVAQVNAACSSDQSFLLLSDRGGTVWGNKTQTPWADQCVLSAWIGIAYGIYSLLLFLIIGLVILYFMVFSEDRPPWCSAADMTTDICRSRH